MSNNEVENVIKRYKQRENSGVNYKYSMFNPAVMLSFQERQRALIQLLSTKLSVSIDESTVLEVGSGSGFNLLDLIQLGFCPKNITGNELLPERAEHSRTILPKECNIIDGDACSLSLNAESFDIVYQSTVFSSLLDDTFQEKLAEKMWSWVKPGGAVLWYDFIYNNPSNPDVRGVSLKRVKELFPDAVISFTRTTLAPPISRRVTKLHPSLYYVLNVFPFLRTHVLCWISKPN